MRVHLINRAAGTKLLECYLLRKKKGIKMKKDMKWVIQFWIDLTQIDAHPSDPWLMMETQDMNIFTACEIFFTFLESQPCHVR